MYAFWHVIIFCFKKYFLLMINEVLFATLHEACENLRMGSQYSLNVIELQLLTELYFPHIHYIDYWNWILQDHMPFQMFPIRHRWPKWNYNGRLISLNLSFYHTKIIPFWQMSLSRRRYYKKALTDTQTDTHSLTDEKVYVWYALCKNRSINKTF